MKNKLALVKAGLAESDRRWANLMERVDTVRQQGAEVKKQYESNKAEVEARKSQDD